MSLEKERKGGKKGKEARCEIEGKGKRKAEREIALEKKEKGRKGDEGERGEMGKRKKRKRNMCLEKRETGRKEHEEKVSH